MTVTPLQAQTFAERLELLAADVGRLRRRFASNDAWTGAYIVDRLAAHVESLDAFMRPTAGELYRRNFAVSGDDDLSAEIALEHVDARARMVGALLGEAQR